MIEELRRGDDDDASGGQLRLLHALERASTLAQLRRDAERQRRIQASVNAIFSRPSVWQTRPSPHFPNWQSSPPPHFHSG